MTKEARPSAADRRKPHYEVVPWTRKTYPGDMLPAWAETEKDERDWETGQIEGYD